MLAMCIAFIACSCSDDSRTDSSNDADDRIEIVRVMELDFQEIARTISYSAHLQAYREVHLAPASPGRIDIIHVDIGSRVSEGQLLVEMDRTQLHQALVQLRSLETDYRRLDTLRKLGSVSQYQYDQISTQYELAKTNVEFLKENTRLRAPFSGTVSGRYYENGEMFSGAPNTQAGKAAILSLVQTGRLKAMVHVAESYHLYVRQGMDVELHADVYPGEVFRGKISRVYPTIDPASRTFSVEVSVPNPNEKLKPGMFARASLKLDRVQAFVVPALAVMKLQGSNERYVFLEENGRAKRLVVELGDRYDDMVELISTQIDTGDKLIIAGQSRLVDQIAVDVQQ